MTILGLFGRLLKRIEEAKDVVISRVNSSFAEIQQAIDANMDALEIDNFGGLDAPVDAKLLEDTSSIMVAGKEWKPAENAQAEGRLHRLAQDKPVDPADLSWPELRTTAAGLGVNGHAVKRSVLERRVRKAMANGSAK